MNKEEIDRKIAVIWIADVVAIASIWKKTRREHYLVMKNVMLSKKIFLKSTTARYLILVEILSYLSFKRCKSR